MKRWKVVRSRALSGALSSPTLKQLKRAAHQARRALTGAPREVIYYHQVDDPYSHLTAQLLARLIARHDITLIPKVVSPPPSWATPDRARWVQLSLRDAQRLARSSALFTFTPPERALHPTHIEHAQRLLAGIQNPERFLALAESAGEALFGGDGEALKALMDEEGALSAELTRQLVVTHAQQREKSGHYLGATLSYDGEWYWGPDRVHLLEDRLIAEGASQAAAPLYPARDAGDRVLTAQDRAQARGRELEFFFSFRSPYSYLAMARTFAMARDLELNLVVRPVLPMVMRGLEVPMAKRVYIVRDARREALRQGIAFGRISDPLGGGIERALSVMQLAREHSRLEDYMLSVARAIFVDEIDIVQERGMREVVERAGLVWKDAQRELARQAWREAVAGNREAMLEAGSWGVPTLRVDGSQTFWGQDRLWMVEEALITASP